MAIFCGKCGEQVKISSPCKVCAAVIHGAGCFQQAQQKARYGHRDWVVWSDAAGSHASPKTRKVLQTVLGDDVTSWTLIGASDAVPMKGFPYLAENMLKQMEMGL